jgi:hypothetical protein
MRAYYGQSERAKGWQGHACECALRALLAPGRPYLPARPAPHLVILVQHGGFEKSPAAVRALHHLGHYKHQHGNDHLDASKVGDHVARGGNVREGSKFHLRSNGGGENGVNYTGIPCTWKTRTECVLTQLHSYGSHAA